MKLFSFLATALFLLSNLNLKSQITLPAFYACEGATPNGITLDLGADSLYAPASACEGSGALRFGSENENLVIHTATQPTSISFLAKGMVGSADFWNGSFHIEESADGLTWNIIDSISGAEALPIDFCASRTFSITNPDTRYLRLYFYTKFSGNDTLNGGGNVNIDSVFVDGGEITGKESVSNRDNALSIYPNPSSDWVKLRFAHSIQNLRIYSAQGQALKDFSIIDNSEVSLNVENLPSGIYFVSFADRDGKAHVSKFFVNSTSK
jgi:hypothetical protein